MLMMSVFFSYSIANIELGRVNIDEIFDNTLATFLAWGRSHLKQKVRSANTTYFNLLEPLSNLLSIITNNCIWFD